MDRINRRILFLLCATTPLVGVHAIAADKKPTAYRSSLKIVNPRRFPKNDIPAERTPLGIQNDYKPWIARLKSGELLMVAFCFGDKDGNAVPKGAPYLERAVFWRSRDGGKTWSARDERPDVHGREFSLNVLSDGTIIMTCHFLARDGANKAGYTHSKIFRSTDDGKTWTEKRIGPGGFPPKAATMADWTTFELPDPQRPGKMLTALGVSLSHGGEAAPSNVFVWQSRDSGKTWDSSLKPDTAGWIDVDGFFCQSTTYRAASGKLLHPVRVDRTGPHWHIAGTPDRLKTERGDNGDRSMLWESTDNGHTWSRHKGDGRFGTYGEMYPRFLRLRDGRLLLTFTVRSNPTDGFPLGLRGLVSDDDGETWDFNQDRIILSPINHGASGGGFGNTVQNDDGTLVSCYSYRDKDGKTRVEAVRWRLPKSKTVGSRTPASPFDVGDASQLFIDRVLVRDSEDVAFTLHPARTHPANPVLKADKPWEGWRVEIYGNVIYDAEEKIFKMWYLGEDRERFPDYAAYYAVSDDGVHWTKPLVGTVSVPGLEKHNAVVEAIHLPSVIKDNADPDPSRRYKMICWVEEPRGYHTMVSPDGLNWTRHSREPISRGGDVITGYYDERRELYVAFPKIGHHVRGHKRRVFWLTTSNDFETWTEPKLVLTPDLRDDAGSLARIEEVRSILDVPDDPAVMRTEFYGVGFYPAESCTLAFVWLFTINNKARYGNQEGPGELQLAVSRDLEHWDRPFREPCVPRGKIGEWDCGFFCTQSRAIRVGDEVWLYYVGSNYTHGTPCLYRKEGTGRKTKYTGSIGLAIWQLDRFVSVDASSDGGSLTTVPIVFSGNRLEVNARTKAGGHVRVSIRDTAGRPIAGFENSHSILGDELRHVVTFSGKKSVASLAGKPITLRFDMKNAELFAFAFRR